MCEMVDRTFEDPVLLSIGVVYRLGEGEGVDEERVIVVLIGASFFRLGGRVEQRSASRDSLARSGRRGRWRIPVFNWLNGRPLEGRADD